MGTHHDSLTRHPATSSKAEHRATASTLSDTVDDGMTIDGSATTVTLPKVPESRPLITAPVETRGVSAGNSSAANSKSATPLSELQVPVRGDPMLQSHKPLKNISVPKAYNKAASPPDSNTPEKSTVDTRRQVGLILQQAKLDESKQRLDSDAVIRRLVKAISGRTLPTGRLGIPTRQESIKEILLSIGTLFAEKPVELPKFLVGKDK